VGVDEYKIPEILDTSNKYDALLIEIGVKGNKE